MWQSWVTLPLPPPGAVQEGGPLPLPGLQEGKEHLAPTVCATATQFRTWPTVSSPPASGTEGCRPATGPGWWSTGSQGPGHPVRGPRNPSPVLEASCPWRIGSAACQLVTVAAGWVGGEGSFRPKASSACPHETRPHRSLRVHCASRGGHPIRPGTRCRWNALG